MLGQSLSPWKKSGGVVTPTALNASVTVYGTTVFNEGNGDFDFTVKKNTSGNAIFYDAGTDKLTLSGGLVADAFKYLDADTGGARNLRIINNNAGNNTGADNYFIGLNAGYNNTSGYENFFCGSYAGETNATGNSNAYIGYQAGRYSTGSSNYFLGSYAGRGVTGSSNTMIGVAAGISAGSASNSVFIGGGAGRDASGANNVIAIGSLAARYSSGVGLVAVGNSSLLNNTGNDTIAIGRNSGQNSGASSNSVFLGYLSGFSETNSNRLHISNSATPLIYGEFDNKLILINGRLRVTDNVATAVAGDIRYNSSTNKHQGYDGTTWNDMY